MNKHLNEIKDNEHVSSILDQIIDQGKVPHAMLFKGPEGTGKEFAAIQFIKALYSRNNTDSDHKIISYISNLSEPMIKYIFPLPRGRNETDQNGPYEKLSPEQMDEISEELEKKKQNPFRKISVSKANNIKINSIRDINKFLSINYSDIKYRVVLISDAHLMNDEAQNALLKNLEEPPEGIIFILVTAYSNKLRETIRSRCWSVNFKPLKVHTIKEILVNYFEIDELTADRVSVFSDGSVSMAMELVENDFEELKEKAIRVLRYSFGKRFNSAYSEFDEIISENDQNKLRLLIRMILTWMNDFHRFKSDNPKIYYDSHLDTIKKFYSKYQDVNLIPLTAALDSISSKLKNNININVAITNLVFEISSVIPR